MRIRRKGEVLAIADAAGCFWLLGLLFAVPGMVFIAGPLGLFTDADRHPVWVRALFAGMGLIAVATGAWVLVSSPASTLVLDRRSGQGVVRRRGVLGTTEERFSLTQYHSVEVGTERDSEGDPVYQVRIWLRDGYPIPISRLWTHDRDGAHRAAEAIREHLRR